MKAKPLRIDESLYSILNDIRIERVKRGVDREMKSLRRISKGTGNLIKKRPDIFDTLVNSPLDNDIKKCGRKIKLN